MTIRLTRLTVTGPGKPTAELDFSSPLTIVTGASGTGKSHVYQCLTFMLGGSKPPEPVPESDGYDNIRLEMVIDGKSEVVLERALSGGNFRKYDLESGDTDSSSVLKEAHKAGKTDTVSHFLLSSCRLADRQIRIDQYGSKGSLSFTDVRDLVMVDEERIITRGSPVVSVQFTTQTREKSVFGLLLTGVDDSAVEPAEKEKSRKSRLSVETRLLEELSAETRGYLASQMADTSEIDGQLQRLTQTIEDATKTISTTQSQINAQESSRREAWNALQPVRSRQLFIASQLDRFSLLQSYYDSDHARLQTMVEAEDEFAALQETDCPLCGRSPSESSGLPPLNNTLVSFAEACEQEIVKIRSLKKDLESTINALQGEQAQLKQRESDLRAALDRMDAELKSVLEVRMAPSLEDLRQLISKRDQIFQAKATMMGLERLTGRLSTTQAEALAKPDKLVFAERASVRTTVELCQEIQELLVEWRFPDGHDVRFDPERNDIVIGKRNRGGLGKGYRAVAYAAFVIGLMRFCLRKSLPHPGVVVLDTPLNPYKGPDEGEDGKVNNETKTAFYKSLSQADNVGQVIVFENDNPPDEVQQASTYHHFSRNTSIGRYGFYPS